MGATDRMGARGALAVPALIAALLAAPGCSAGESGEDPGAIRRAPGFSLEDINPESGTHGRTLTLSDLYAERGVVLNFIASWCAPCWTEVSSLQKLADDGLPIVCVAADEYGTTEDLLRKAEEAGLSLPILHVPKERISGMEELYDHEMLPATYVIDASGVVREVFQGLVNEKTLLEAARIGLPR